MTSSIQSSNPSHSRLEKEPNSFAATSFSQSPSPHTQQVKQCAFCNKTQEKIKKCTACLTYYCNVDCQKKHWPQHKKLCVEARSKFTALHHVEEHRRKGAQQLLRRAIKEVQELKSKIGDTNTLPDDYAEKVAEIDRLTAERFEKELRKTDKFLPQIALEVFDALVRAKLDTDDSEPHPPGILTSRQKAFVDALLKE